ncbi:NAD-binding protein [Brevibacterium pigmentatum]|uniref:NAD-binding protein n=1 Tax=Brevibacterium pigmentatum TaxID=1496080 RepID=UPI00141F0FDC
MIVSSLANAYSLQTVAKLDAVLPDENESRLRANDKPLDTGDAEVVVLGMGRIGRGAYERFVERGDRSVIGIDNDHTVVEGLRGDGFNLLEGDATDHEFWHRLVVGGSAHTVVLPWPCTIRTPSHSNSCASPASPEPSPPSSNDPTRPRTSPVPGSTR